MKKILLTAATIVLVFVLGINVFADVKKFGDINADNVVDASDALIVLQHAAKITVLDEALIELADVTGNQIVDANDALDILKFAAKIIDKFAVEDMVEVTDVPTDAPTTTPMITAIPTDPPIELPDVVVPTMIPLPIVEADMANYVEGITPELISANGATEENEIFTFTDDNIKNREGVSYKNPFAGKTELVESFEKALAGQTINLTDLQKTKYDPEAVYPEPVWSTGVSLSFWAKYDWDKDFESDDDPILVFHRSTRGSKDFAVSLLLDGTVRYEEGEDAHNSFRGNGAICGNYNEWNYYTITMTNDWICVYVNGQECAYQSVSLSKEAIGLFNGGYMTKYNVAGVLTDEQLANDIRGYYKKNMSGNSIIPEATRCDSGVFECTGYYNNARLLMECIIDEQAEIVIGGATTFKVVGSMGNAVHSLEAGTQAAGLKAYFVELTPEQVAANYAAEAEQFLK